MIRSSCRSAKPAIAADALFSFFYTWNDFYGPLLYTGENPSNWTLSVGLAKFRNLHQVQWNLTMAATLIVHAARDRAVLRRPAGVRRGRHPDRGEGMRR